MQPQDIALYTGLTLTVLNIFDRVSILKEKAKSLFNSEFYIGLGGDMVCPPHHYSKIPLDNFNILFYTIGEK